MVSCISLFAVVALAAVASAVPAGRSCFGFLIYAPVCASNGKVYSSACMVKWYNIVNNANLKIVHDGRCGEVFQVDDDNEVEGDLCLCTKVYEPVCGSDHQTYSNMCMLKCAAKKDKSLKMLHEGSCVLPLTNFKNWPNVHEIPEVDDFPEAGRGFDLMAKEKAAPCGCSKERKPVCGSNLYTYRNKCMLECAMKKDKSLKMLYPFVCIILP